MRSYALRGVKEWASTMGRGNSHTRAEEILGARIANNEYLASTAVLAGGREEGSDLIPVPNLSVGNIEWAFFKPLPIDEGAELAFDIVLLLPGRKHIGFRLEPAHKDENGRHAYSHVQLSSRFRRRKVVPENPLDWLPKSYPAFPVPGTCSLDRFLMLVVALHGFPSCARTVLRSLCETRPTQFREYFGRVSALLDQSLG